MAAHGDALLRGLQVGFVGDRILEVAQIVADIGEQLDQRDPEVGHVSLLPVRHDQG